MLLLNVIAYFFGGAFASNAIPHLVSGVAGRPFQSPFAKPPGKGLSSSKVNVLWGSFNFLIAYLLICQVGEFDLRSSLHAGLFGVGFLLMSLVAAHSFGKFHGGDLSKSKSAAPRNAHSTEMSVANCLRQDS